MIIKIGDANTPTPSSYKVTPRQIKKKYSNSKGDMFIDVVNTKYDLEVGWLPMDEYELEAFISSISSASFTVQYYWNGELRTGIYECDDNGFDMQDFVKVARWKSFSLTFRQL